MYDKTKLLIREITERDLCLEAACSSNCRLSYNFYNIFTCGRISSRHPPPPDPLPVAEGFLSLSSLYTEEPKLPRHT